MKTTTWTMLLCLAFCAWACLKSPAVLRAQDDEGGGDFSSDNGSTESTGGDDSSGPDDLGGAPDDGIALDPNDPGASEGGGDDLAAAGDADPLDFPTDPNADGSGGPEFVDDNGNPINAGPGTDLGDGLSVGQDGQTLLGADGQPILDPDGNPLTLGGPGDDGSIGGDDSATPKGEEPQPEASAASSEAPPPSAEPSDVAALASPKALDGGDAKNSLDNASKEGDDKDSEDVAAGKKYQSVDPKDLDKNGKAYMGDDGTGKQTSVKRTNIPDGTKDGHPVLKAQGTDEKGNYANYDIDGNGAKVTRNPDGTWSVTGKALNSPPGSPEKTVNIGRSPDLDRQARASGTGRG